MNRSKIFNSILYILIGLICISVFIPSFTLAFFSVIALPFVFVELLSIQHDKMVDERKKIEANYYQKKY